MPPRPRNVAKILSDGDPHLLLVFYRSLFSPYEDGLIIADARGRDELRKAIEEAGAFVAPGPPMTLCTARLKVHGPKYSIQQSEVCTQDGWDKVMHGTFQWSAKSRPRVANVRGDEMGGWPGEATCAAIGEEHFPSKHRYVLQPELALPSVRCFPLRLNATDGRFGPLALQRSRRLWSKVAPGEPNC